MAEFKKGDKVRHISGGPKMAVVDVGDFIHSGGPEDGVLCQWFALVKGIEQPQEKAFDAAVLEMDNGNAQAAEFRASRS